MLVLSTIGEAVKILNHRIAVRYEAFNFLQYLVAAMKHVLQTSNNPAIIVLKLETVSKYFGRWDFILPRIYMGYQ